MQHSLDTKMSAAVLNEFDPKGMFQHILTRKECANVCALVQIRL